MLVKGRLYVCIAVPEDLHDFITGHSGGDSASNYGEGHSFSIRYHALNTIKRDYLE